MNGYGAARGLSAICLISLSRSTSPSPKRLLPMNTVFCRNTKNIIIMDSSYSVLGKGKARLAGRALVGGVRFSVSGWTKCPEVGACSAICCFLLSSHLKAVQNCLDKYKRSQNIHKNLDAHQYYN